VTTYLYLFHLGNQDFFPDKYAIEAGVKGKATKTRFFNILFVKKGQFHFFWALG